MALTHEDSALHVEHERTEREALRGQATTLLASEEFGTFRHPFKDLGLSVLHPDRRSDTVTRWRSKMTTSKQAAGADGDAPVGRKALVVKGAAAYHAEQGSEYVPGISSETV